MSKILYITEENISNFVRGDNELHVPYNYKRVEEHLNSWGLPKVNPNDADGIVRDIIISFIPEYVTNIFADRSDLIKIDCALPVGVTDIYLNESKMGGEYNVFSSAGKLANGGLTRLQYNRIKLKSYISKLI